MKNTFENVKNRVSKEYLEDLYLTQKLSIDAITKVIHTCRKHVSDLIKYYGIHRDNNKLKSEMYTNPNSPKQQNFKNICDRLPKETIYQWYVIEDNNYKDAPQHFGVNRSMFDKLCLYYNIKKDKSKAGYKGLETRKIKYGEDNFNNWRKGLETRIKNSGSLEESYRKGFEKQKKTNLEKYGTEVFLNSEYLATHFKKKNSKPNKTFGELLNKSNIDYTQEFVIGTKSYDFKIGNTLVEINPTATHNVDWSPYSDHTGKTNKYHLEKSKLAIENNYRCIHVWDWDDKNKIISLLLKRPTLYARNCEIRNVSTSEGQQYLNTYHLQGYARCSIRLGLYNNNELVSIMTFSKARYNKNYQYELIRYCSNYNVIGGAEKLFKHFVTDYNAQSIISYCDNSKFTGKTYVDLGFELKSKGKPTCHWYNIKTKEHYTDMLIRKQGFSRIVNHCEPEQDCLPTNNNTTLMLHSGFFRVFDCGQSVYAWHVKNKQDSI